MVFRSLLMFSAAVVVMMLLTPVRTVYACTPTPTPTATSTPDEDGNVPPTATALPTRTPVPVGTVAAQLEPRATVIVEGEILSVQERYGGYGNMDSYTFQLAVNRYYKGDGDSVMEFSMTVPCIGVEPPIETEGRMIYFLAESDRVFQFTSGHDTRSTIQAATGTPPRRVYSLGVPVTGIVLVLGLVFAAIFFRQKIMRAV